MPSQNLSTFGFVMTFLILTLLVGMHSLFVTVHLVGILSLEAAQQIFTFKNVFVVSFQMPLET